MYENIVESQIFSLTQKHLLNQNVLIFYSFFRVFFCFVIELYFDLVLSLRSLAQSKTRFYRKQIKDFFYFFHSLWNTHWDIN